MKINESRASSDDCDEAAATLQNPTGELVKGMRSRLPATVPPFSLIVECEFLKPSASGAATALNSNSFTSNGAGNTGSSPSSRGASPYLEEVFPCECRFSEAKDPESQACGERSSCINRSLSIECNPEDCVCRDNCRNQRFQKHQYADVEVFETPGKGFGLRTLQDVEPGQFIFEYVGEVLTQRQFEERAELYAEQGQPHFYFMTLQNDQIIDATRKGNLARFMNHSCNPNCATQKWIVRGRLRIGLFALKRIKAGSELTFDYKFIRFGGEAQRCLCGEANCKGVIGEEQSVVPAHGLTLSSSPQGRGRASKRRPQSTAQEEEDVEAAHKRFTEATGLNNEEDLTLLARILLRTEERDAIIDLLRILKKTTSDELLMRRFVTLHGLQIISVLMGLHWRDAEMIGLCVAILDGLPIANKNFVEDAHVEEKLERLINGRDDLDASTKQQIERILERWRGLRKVFRIPRASEASKGGGTSDGQEVPTSATPSNAPPTAAGYSLREGDFLLISRGGSSSWPNFTGTSIETEIPNRHRGLAVEDRRRPAAFANHQEEDIGRRSPQSSFLAGRSSIPGRHHSDRRRRSRSPPRRDASPTTKMPPGWHQAYDSNRRPYYYHEVTRETRWEPPLSAVTAKPVGRDEGKKLDEIIERARKAALSRDPPRDAEKEPSRPSTMSPVSSTHAPAHSSPPLPELEARFRDAVGSCVEKYLSRWCRSQIEPGSSRFKELCRKLTHGIVGKEFRQLRERMTGVDAHEHGREMISWIECDSKELPAGKRAKVKVFLLQYLKDHGYRIEE